ncbi:MAG: 4'-phosphopantetheinyl transferase family protein [Brotaphodocola sp.]
MTHIYFLDVSLSNHSEKEKEMVLKQIFPVLTPQRRKKVEELRFLEDKLCSAGAGVLFDLGLKRYGLKASEVEVAYKENQKPYIKDHPGIHFNLSHSGFMVMAAFSDHEIGCDIEKIKKENLNLARRFFHPNEWKMLEESADKKELFFRYWTLKESVMKVTGKGMKLPLNAFCVYPEEIPIRVEIEGIIRPYEFREYDLPGYRAALCVEEHAGDVFFTFQNLQDVV